MSVEAPAGFVDAVDGVRITPVDEVGLEQRAALLCTRSVKAASKAAMLDLTIQVMDLTTLEGADTPGRVRALCSRARRPDTTDGSAPPVAAVCVYPEMVPEAATALAGSPVAVASVAGGFPAGLSPLQSRLAEIAWAVAAGADEVDIVLNRSAFLSGCYQKVYDEIVSAKQASGAAHLKVILETGELGAYDQIRRASMLAMAAGADFIKTSTGKLGISATPATALCMAEAIRDMAEQTGRTVGLKLAGGIRTAKQAWHYLVIVGETLGPAWLTPERFRLGASSLLNDVLMQRAKQRDGRYQRREDFSVD
ncbi:deoxyribose-phosphate aldolase [Candidatus Poriferisocius sp.]|uniref:deoxyribose-phosphate aldolase n=1 Tax=Candidatus Poriferisocius sp. TaxID=3101276 RepID=UPI003B02A0C0